jgi:predicted transposase/invertase (TIGR01784 family)
VFKLIFGDQRNVDILAALLKAALKLPDSEYDRLTIVDPHLKRESEDDKMGILDVKVHTKSGIVINVEIQLSTSAELRDRIVFYLVKMLTEQLKRGDTWDQAERVISIIIMDEMLIPEELEYYNEYALCNRKTGKIFTDLLGLNIFELPKLPETTDGSALWNWGSFFVSESEEEFQMVAEQDTGVRKAVAVLMELSDDERNSMLADARDRWVTDHQNALKHRYRLGLGEGEQIGLKKGEEKAYREKLEIARKMKEAGLPLEQISGFIDLPPKKIAAL